MRIDLLIIGGSTEGVIPPEIETPGVGGSELMLLQWSKEMARRGHQVAVYNNPRKPGVYDGVRFAHEKEYVRGEYRDVLISFRGPKLDETVDSNYGIAVGWSADQFAPSYQEPWYALTDGLVGLSYFHKEDHRTRCGLKEDRMKILEIGSDPSEYPVTPKKPYQFIYNSLPIRGLIHLAELWPLIREKYTEATLLVTSDYRLWTGGRLIDNEEYRSLFVGMPGVSFLGAIPRSELVKRELESEIHLYPCTYEELFCISNSEAQMAGCYAITSSVGALSTTNFTGHISPHKPGSPAFRDDVLSVIDVFYAQSLESRREQHNQIRAMAHRRFDWNTICGEWELYFEELQKVKKR